MEQEDQGYSNQTMWSRIEKGFICKWDSCGRSVFVSFGESCTKMVHNSKNCYADDEIYIEFEIQEKERS